MKLNLMVILYSVSCPLGFDVISTISSTTRLFLNRVWSLSAEISSYFGYTVFSVSFSFFEGGGARGLAKGYVDD